MPEDNQSHISQYLEQVRRDLQVQVAGVGEIIFFSERHAKDVIKQAAQLGSGRSVIIIPTGGTIPDARVARVSTNFEVNIIDQPQAGKSLKRPVYEVLEDVVRCLHATNYQELKSVCSDTTVTGWNLTSVEDTFDVYSVAVTATLHLKQTSTS